MLRNKDDCVVEAILDGLNFRGATWSGQDLRQTSFLGANFDEADLRGSKFTIPLCLRASFQGAALKGAAFYGHDGGRVRPLFSEDMVLLGGLGPVC